MSEPSASEDRLFLDALRHAADGDEASIEVLRSLARDGDASAHEALGEFHSRPGFGMLDSEAAEAHFRSAYGIDPVELSARGLSRVLLCPDPEGDPIADRCD